MQRAILVSALALTASLGLSVPGRSASAVPATPAADEEVLEVSIMELTQIDWQPGAKLPKKIAELDGKRVRIKGYMALQTPEGSSDFRLTYDQCGCSGAKASHFVQVALGDATTDYDPSEVVVEGVFSVGEEEEDGFVTSLYRLKADSVD